MSFWYLATPYTNYAEGEDAASRLACEAAGLLLDAGVRVFSPIAHFHAIRQVIGPRPHAFWLDADQPFMDAARGIVVLKMAGYRDSIGVQHEVERFTVAGKPVVMMEVGVVPPELLA